MDIALIIPWRPSSPERQTAMQFVLEHLTNILQPAQTLLVDDPDPEDFNRGRALNRGVDESTAELLVFADADFLVSEACIIEAVMRAQEPGVSYVVPFTEILFLTREASEWIVSVEVMPRSVGPHEIEHHMRNRGAGTFNVMRREVFEHCGRFDPRFRGWGFEDAAWDQAASTLWAPATWLQSQGFHLWHPSARRPETAQYQQSLALCRRYERASGDPAAMRALIEEGRQQ